MTIPDLIAKIKAAPEGSRELDVAACNKALSIGEAWNLLQEAAAEIERLSLLNIKLACAQREIERLTKERDEAQMVANHNSVRANDANAPHFAEGMPLRDWFAGQALAGRLPLRADQWTDGRECDDIAKACYRIADAMIAEREKP